MRLLFLISSIFLTISSLGQFSDTVIQGKNANYDRTEGPHKFKGSVDRPLVSEMGTMMRVITVSPFNQLEGQYVLINGKKTGLAISFWSNGIVKTIDYYYDDKLWETISKTDSGGKLLHPGTLVNGNGLVFEYGLDGGRITTTSYKNGYPTGPFQSISYRSIFPIPWVTSAGPFITEGNLTRKPSAVNYLPGYRFKYIDETDTISYAIDIDNFNSVFANKETFPYPIIEKHPDTVRQFSTAYHLLGIYFDDPAVIPTGKWRVFDASMNRQLVAEIDHDENGNPILLVVFRDGRKVLEESYPPCSKRKITVSYEPGKYEGKCQN